MVVKDQTSIEEIKVKVDFLTEENSQNHKTEQSKGGKLDQTIMRKNRQNT